MSDIINLLAGLESESDTATGAAAAIATARAARPDAVANAQASFEALLEPAEPGAFTYAERYAVAAFVAGLTQAGGSFYLDLLADESEELVAPVEAAIAAGRTQGPYIAGPAAPAFALHNAAALGARLAAAFDYAHLLTFHPKDASPAALGHLYVAGWDADTVVSLSQLVAFEAFQLRVAHGAAVLAGQAPAAPAAPNPRPTSAPDWQPIAGINTAEDVVRPYSFVNHALGWVPWIAALDEDELTAEQRDALIKPERAKSAYFRLLARDAAALKARTLTDFDIFYNVEGGLPRAERELAATVVSRFNGCEYCASVHQGRTVEEGGDRAAVDRLLFEGIEADLGSELWDAIRRAALALTATPLAFGQEHVDALRAAGLNDIAILDVVNAASFFNWANRLMLTLGTAELPARFR